VGPFCASLFSQIIRPSKRLGPAAAISDTDPDGPINAIITTGQKVMLGSPKYDTTEKKYTETDEIWGMENPYLYPTPRLIKKKTKKNISIVS